MAEETTPPITKKAPEKSEAQRHCEGRGGTWDEETKTCKMPQYVPKPGETPKTIGEKVVSPEEFEREKRLTGTPQDPALLRRQEQQRQENIQTATEAGLIKTSEEQVKSQPTDQELQVAIEQATPEEIASLTSFEGISNLLSGKPVTIGGRTIQTGLRGQETEVLGGSLPIGIGAIGQLPPPSLPTTTSTFLNNLQTGGKVAQSAKGVLTAPAKAKGISDTLKVSAGSIIAFSGLGSLKSITSNLLTKKVERIETEVSKLGEQLTKVPEASSLGFSLDEDGQLYEYTPEKALRELEDIEDSLNEAETSLQTASIGQTFLKITGRYDTAQAEIDKQKREITVARGKVLSQLANPSETLLNSRDFFRGLDLIE